MLDFLKLESEAFGLDISDLSLKIIQLRKRSGFLKLVSFGEEKIKPGIIKEGEIKNEDKLAEIIKEAIGKVKGEKIKTKYVVASLPEEKAFLQVIQMPKMAQEDLKSAVVYEAENYIPLPIEQAYLDFQIIPSDGNNLNHFNILIAAAPKKIADSYLFSLKKAGLQPKVLEIESVAIARALIKDEVAASAVLLIDIGRTGTRFIIFSGSSLTLTFFIPLSSENFDEIIAKNLGISLAEAETIKIKYGLEGQTEKGGIKIDEKKEKVFEVLAPALIDLVQQIRKHLDYYQAHAPYKHLSSSDFSGNALTEKVSTGKEISKILLCGSGANLKGLTKFLAAELKIPVELGNPWVNILSKGQKEIPELPLKKSLGYTTALGLALRGIKYD